MAKYIGRLFSGSESVLSSRLLIARTVERNLIRFWIRKNSGDHMIRASNKHRNIWLTGVEGTKSNNGDILLLPPQPNAGILLQTDAGFVGLRFNGKHWQDMRLSQIITKIERGSISPSYLVTWKGCSIPMKCSTDPRDSISLTGLLKILVSTPVQYAAVRTASLWAKQMLDTHNPACHCRSEAVSTIAAKLGDCQEPYELELLRRRLVARTSCDCVSKSHEQVVRTVSNLMVIGVICGS